MANNRRRNNYISEIWVNRCKVKGNQEIKKAVKDYFGKLYQKDHMRRLTLNGINFRRLFEDNKLLLENAFSENEIKESLDLCMGIKLQVLMGLI